MPHLRSGAAFTVYEGREIVADGHIKPTGRIVMARGSGPLRPTAVRDHILGIARRYQHGISPEPYTFTFDEDDEVDEGAVDGEDE